MALTLTLPDYSAAPVVEVVVGLEFSPIPNFGIISLAALHDLWESRFPTVEEHEALPPTRPMRAPGGFELQFGQGLPPARLWLISEGRDRLIQVQRDRLLFNWRKIGSAQYPRHEVLLREFAQLFREFRESSPVRGSDMKPLVTEWTYVNRLESGQLLDGEALSAWTTPDLPFASEPLATSVHHVRRFHYQDRVGQIEFGAAPTEVGESQVALLTISAKCFHEPDATVQDAVDCTSTAWEVARATFHASITDSARRDWGEGQ